MVLTLPTSQHRPWRITGKELQHSTGGSADGTHCTVRQLLQVQQHGRVESSHLLPSPIPMTIDPANREAGQRPLLVKSVHTNRCPHLSCSEAQALWAVMG